MVHGPYNIKFIVSEVSQELVAFIFRLKYFRRPEFRISCDVHTATFVVAIGMLVVSGVKCNAMYTLYLCSRLLTLFL